MSKHKDDLDSDLNWLLERHKPGYSAALREQQHAHNQRDKSEYKGPSAEQIGAEWFRKNRRKV